MKDGRTAILKSPCVEDAEKLLNYIKKSCSETDFLARYPKNGQQHIGQGQYIGVTSPAFCKYQKTYCKKPEETPYTVEGRAIHWERTRKKMTLPRMEEILTSSTLGMLIAYGKTKPIYNLEYFLNRMYALNRDKMRCRICENQLSMEMTNMPITFRKNLTALRKLTE